jgi:GNAT superfamily N-acetyltransferase
MSSTIRDPSTPNIEPASQDDIVAAAYVYQAAAEALSEQFRARNPWTNSAARAEDLQQAIRTLATLRAGDDRSVIVARDQHEIIGLTAVQIQHPHAHIAFYFVHPTAQNRGVGRQLLDRIRDVIDQSGATVTTLASSRDPKAWQRYLRFGLYPGPPLLPFRAVNPSFPGTIPENRDLANRPITSNDLDTIAELDREVRGADRRERIGQWLAEGSVGSIVNERVSGAAIGYALVTMGPHHGQIGPVVSTSLEHFSYLLDLALYVAGTVPNPHKRPWRVYLSARNHLAIGPLLDAGFSAENLVNWFESDPIGKWDRYIFRDEDEL